MKDFEKILDELSIVCGRDLMYCKHQNLNEYYQKIYGQNNTLVAITMLEADLPVAVDEIVGNAFNTYCSSGFTH